jgi:hypothetical protein
MDRSVARKKYCKQRREAGRRGIGWRLTFEQWLDWWGNDLDRRGPHYDELGMCRFGDVGPYALDNIYKGTPKQNGHTRSKSVGHKRSLEAQRRIEAARSACEPIAKDDHLDFMTEDERELHEMFKPASVVY